jgi:RNA polymerase sigma factor (sigma-70 family)
MTTDTLDTLAALARSGNREAIDHLLVRSGPELRRVARRVCQTNEDAEDAVQSTLLILTSRTSLLRGVNRFTKWVLAIVRHQCLRLARVAWREQSDEGEHLDERLESRLASVDDVVLARELAAIISALPEPVREIFVLRELEGLSGPEAARRLDISLDAAKMRLHRARHLVREALAEG